MFGNVSASIKRYANFIFILTFLGYIGSGLAAWVLLAEVAELGFLGFVVFLVISVLGFFVGRFATCVLYGFGQLVENSDMLVELTAANNSSPAQRAPIAFAPVTSSPVCTTQESANNTASEAVVPFAEREGKIRCPKCNSIQNENRIRCYNCEVLFTKTQNI